jgi:hypothetical protein
MLTVILCLDMDIDKIYIKKGNSFAHHGGLVPVNFSLYQSMERATKQATASVVLGRAHATSAGGLLQSIKLQQIEYTPRHEDPPGLVWSSYKGNLLPVIGDYSPDDIAALNATSEDFVTSHRLPYYQLEAFEVIGDGELNNTARIYGCGLFTFAVRAYDRNDSDWLWICTVPFVLC